MEDSQILGEDLPLPPARLFERLSQLPGYTWDQSIEPWHSTYGHWHVLGFRHSGESDVSTPAATSSGPSSLARISPRTEARTAFQHHSRNSLSASSSEVSLSRLDEDSPWLPVIARVSWHVVRLEREFHMIKTITQTLDPDSNHTIRPIDLFRLPRNADDAGPLMVAIYESPGHNTLREFVTFGPASFVAGNSMSSSNDTSPDEQVSLSVFLDFAIGACDCLELLHYGLKTIHGEIRGDAFHFHLQTGVVKLTNTGNGARSFDNALGEGWSTLSKELGVKTKLQYIAPEQTGRMPTEPDSRTDIYSLGVLFWTMLVGRTAFTGTDPVDVVQNVLAKRLPPVSSLRMDVPDAVSAVIQKMTQKSVNDRYHTISSVKKDLSQIAELLGDGDSEALKTFQIAQSDVSSFFTLPSAMFGRREEYDKILETVKKVSRRQQTALTKMAAHKPGNPYGGGSNSSVSESRNDSLDAGSASSDSGSVHTLTFRSNSGSNPNPLARVSTHESVTSIDSAQRPGPAPTSGSALSGSQSRNSGDSVETTTSGGSGASGPSHPTGHIDSLNALTRHRAAPKRRASGRCEIITVSGEAGIGKTDLLNRVQPAIRKLGYIAIARLDQARRVPFEPFAKILASLLRQIFSERDVTTDYHNSVRAALRPIWPTLHKVLELPEQLMSFGGREKPFFPRSSAAQHLFRDNPFKSEPSKRVGLPHLDQGQSSVDFFLSNAASMNMRLMETFLEILRTLSQYRLICLGVDDLHFADDETLGLILNIMKAKFSCVLIVTSRKSELTSEAIKSLFEAEGPNITRIVLTPLGEEEIVEYVAATMHQEPSPLLTPLAAVIQEKSLGNPFYLRMMLETCYSKTCIWYSWKNARWEFDLDRIFTEFVAPSYGESLGLSFITRRLQEIPVAARSIIVWAALLGSPFSFSLVQTILTSDSLYADGDNEVDKVAISNNLDLVRQSEADLVVGLQFLVQAYIIVPDESDDEFRFANGRLAQAVASLRESHEVEQMHFIIAQTMMKHLHDGRSRYTLARHVALASRLIRSRVAKRFEYRKILWDAAQTAIRSGARPTAMWYLGHCLDLLQKNPWDEKNSDAGYGETQRVYITTAETLWSQGEKDKALKLLDDVFAHAVNPVSKSRAWIVRAKIYAQSGNHRRAMKALLTCLDELGVELRDLTTFEQCDAAYQKLKTYLDKTDLAEVARQPCCDDPNMIAIGTVMAEAMAVTYWDDPLTFYRMAVEMMNLHLFKGGFVQISFGCFHLAMISFSRFRNLELAVRLSDFALSLADRCPDLWMQSRASIVYNLYVSHFRVPVALSLPALETSLEASFSMGDPYVTLVSLSSMAMTRLYLGHDMGQLEAFCNESPEDIPDWTDDTRGGASLVAVRQVARALQGKTKWRSARGVLDDEHHMSHEFIAYLEAHASNPDRPRDIYHGLGLIPLYLYGHHTEAIKVGTKLLDTISGLWSVRVTYIAYFYLAISHLTYHVDNPTLNHLDANVDVVLKIKAAIDFARKACDANYGMWSLLLEALLCECHRDAPSAIVAYEAAVDHCQIHGWPLEEALALELQGDFLVRRGAKRAARSIIQEAIVAWTSISAVGKAAQLAEKHEWLLKTATASKVSDAACQTVDSVLTISRAGGEQEHAIISSKIEENDRKQLWIEQNGVTAGERQLDISGVGIDIIDLSSILESSQVMSSELQIDKLFTKMAEIILDSCNGSDLVVIAKEFENHGFAVAAIGDTENGPKSFVDGLPFSEMDDQMAQQISLYVTRTKEEVFVHNIMEDERFSNVCDSYQAKHPLGRSVIALPIMHAGSLIAAIQIEGKPNSFTQRNVVVLRLLCNQIGISLSNALLFHEVRKVSAKNASMIEAQKRALAQAREAEQKAKVAEAEARRNVKLKEDAAKAKSIFLANISHDLRTPMNGVIGLSELLKKTNLTKEQDEYTESIRVCADTLLTLINDILDFSKLEAGKMKLATIPLNVKDTIWEVVRALRYTHRGRNVETIEDLDELPSDLVVLGDPVRLHQIFMNLLSNSYKFTPTGSVTVSARAFREGKGRVRLECAVSDTGIGIPEEQKSRLFRPFSQADSSTARSYGGSGLGLSICKAIIEDVLGGAIWLESTLGVGTTVAFHLMFNRAPKKAVVKAPWSQDFNQIGSKGTPKPATRDLTMIPRDQIRVCIAEDNPINQKIAVKFVTGLGLQCEAYSDGLQAVEALRARSKEGNPFHVVLMDVQMPTLDGYNATREIRRDPDPNVNEVLVIAMTASAIEGDREKCLDAGMNNYLPKPVRSSTLHEMLDRYLAPAPSISRSRLSMRDMKRGSLSRDFGTAGSGSSASSGSQVIALTPDEDGQLPLSPTPGLRATKNPLEEKAPPAKDRPGK